MNSLNEKIKSVVKKHDPILRGKFKTFFFQIFEDLPFILKEAIRFRNSVFEYRQYIAEEKLLILRVAWDSVHPQAHFGILIEDGKYVFWQLKDVDNLPADDAIKKEVMEYCDAKNIQYDPNHEDLILSNKKELKY